jgi:putative PIN family toxin of toxin-antitoxin system
MSMRRIQVVIDTNIVVSAARSNLGASYALMQHIRDKRWQTNVSTPLVLEYEEQLKAEMLRQGKDPATADEFLDYLVSMANRRNIFFKWRPVLADPGDDFLLELAIASSAQFIVTFNLRDFARARAFGIVPIRPAEFLTMLEEGI